MHIGRCWLMSCCAVCDVQIVLCCLWCTNYRSACFNFAVPLRCICWERKIWSCAILVVHVGQYWGSHVCWHSCLQCCSMASQTPPACATWGPHSWVTSLGVTCTLSAATQTLTSSGTQSTPPSTPMPWLLLSSSATSLSSTCPRSAVNGTRTWLTSFCLCAAISAKVNKPVWLGHFVAIYRYIYRYMQWHACSAVVRFWGRQVIGYQGMCCFRCSEVTKFCSFAVVLVMCACGISAKQQPDSRFNKL